MKIISEKEVYKTRIFSVEEMDIELDTGSIRHYHTIKRLPTVSIFPVTEKHEIYLVEQYRPMYQALKLEAIAGYMDKEHETPLDTAKRELHEEGGLTANRWEELREVDMAGSVISTKCHLFLARNVTEGKAEPEESEEQMRIVKMPLGQAVDLALHGGLDMSISILGVMILDKMRREGTL